MSRSTHPAEEIMDYLHVQLFRGTMNEEQLAEGRGLRERYEKIFSPLASVTQTQGCVEESEGGVVLGGNANPYRFQLSVCSKCAWVPQGQAGGKCCPPAALGSRRLSQSLHLQSNSIKSRPAANKSWQILSFGIHFGTAVVPSKRGDGEGEASSQ